jgi:EF hand
MRPRYLASTLTALAWLAAPCLAQSVGATETASLVESDVQDGEAIDDIVRLPGQGRLKPDAPHGRHTSGRLVPGGGLIVSFDANDDGHVTPDELRTGAVAAFTLADANSDGSLSALEQQDWANNLPTRDDTLANPVRFDPNLDRVVSVGEFVSVVAQLTADHADPDGNIYLSKLAAPEPREPGKRLWTDVNEENVPIRR